MTGIGDTSVRPWDASTGTQPRWSDHDR